MSRANRALVTESYRDGQAWDLRSEDDAYERDSHPAKQFGSDRPYFEVLVVEDLTEAAGELAAGRATAVASPG